MKVALVHDYLIKFGGAERVLLALHELFPKSPVYTLIFDEGLVGSRPEIKALNIRPSFLQKAPLVFSKTDYYRALMPMAVEQFDLSGFDLVISDSHSFAKGVVTKPSTCHINYCHTTTRYLWHQSSEARKHLGWFSRKILPYGLNYMRAWDQLAAQRVDYFIANSQVVAERIKKFYRRDSTVVYPPVDCDKFKILPTKKIKNYYLMVGRLEFHKAADIVVKAFNELELPLKVVGQGEQLAYLQRIARPNIEFFSNLDDNRTRELLSACRALICPQEEDFGITAVEAMAAGRPVIAFNKGGITETLIEGKTGVFFTEQSPESLYKLVKNFDHNQFRPTFIRQHAVGYNKARFKKEIKKFINQKIG